MKKFLLHIALIVLAKSVFAQSAVDLKSSINYCPTVVDKGSKIVFQSNKNTGFELYIATFDSTQNEYKKAKSIDAINSAFGKYHMIGGPSYSEATKTLYFFAHNKENSSFDLYTSKYVNNEFEAPTNTSYSNLINTEASEKFPTISPDGNLLVFVRQSFDANSNSYKNELIYCENKGEWSEPQKLPDAINSMKPFAPKLQWDNKTLFFNANGAVYKTIFKDGVWGSPVALSDKINQRNIKHLHVGPNDEYGFFVENNQIFREKLPVQDRVDSYKIISGQIIDSEYRTPIKATVFLTNETTNTNKNITPSDSSNLDVSLRKGSKYKITIVKQYFEPLVVKYDLTELKETIEDTSSFPLMPKMKQIEISVSDAETHKNVNVTINIDNLNLDEKIKLKNIVGVDGKYTVNLREGNQYNIEIESREGYSFSKKEISVPRSKDDPAVLALASNGNSDNEQSIDDLLGDLFSGIESKSSESGTSTTSNKGEAIAIAMEVQPLHKGAHVELNDIYFDSGSWEMKEESNKELARVLELISSNPKIIIEIGAHTDNIGSSNFNLELSNKRAKTIYDYLISKGAQSSNLKSRGYGHTKPVASNGTEDGRAKNRRVELLIVK